MLELISALEKGEEPTNIQNIFYKDSQGNIHKNLTISNIEISSGGCGMFIPGGISRWGTLGVIREYCRPCQPAGCLATPIYIKKIYDFK